MFDEKVLELLTARLDAECYARDKAIEKQLAEVRAVAAHAGLSHSSSVIDQEGRILEEHLSAWGWLVWNTLARIVSQLGVTWSGELPADIRAAVEANVLPLGTTFTNRLAERQKLIGINRNRTLDLTRDAALKKLSVEGEPFAEQIRQRQLRQPSAPITQVFNAPVGAVQIGTGATANVTQAIDSEAKQVLVPRKYSRAPCCKPRTARVSCPVRPDGASSLQAIGL
jgi:hypothetical protein